MTHYYDKDSECPVIKRVERKLKEVKKMKHMSWNEHGVELMLKEILGDEK